MKHLIILGLMICSALSVVGQSITRFNVTDFKEQNDSLCVQYEVKVNPNSVATSQLLQISPRIEAGDSVLFLPGTIILGKNKTKVMTRFDRSLVQRAVLASIPCDTLLTYAITMPYDLWMDSASLVLQQELIGYRKQNTITVYQLKDKVELSPREPYQVNPALALVAPQREVKVRRRQGKAYLDFQVGRSVILPSYRRNPEELLKIDEAISDVISNPDAILQGLYVEGYASPEGPYITNERLSAQRAEALKEYIRTKFKLSENLFKVHSVAEDWEGLEEMVKDSDMPQKERVLEIIATVGVFDGRENVLMRLNNGIPYRFMLKEMFPELRRVEYQIDYAVKDYDLKQTEMLLDKKPSDLSELELYTLAMSYEVDSPAYNNILLEVIPNYFPTTETAHINAAAILIRNGELATAKRYLGKAGETAAALNNRGVLCLLEGDLDQAEALLTQAQTLDCAEATANLEELQAKRADNIKQERYK